MSCRSNGASPNVAGSRDPAMLAELLPLLEELFDLVERISDATLPEEDIDSDGEQSSPLPPSTPSLPPAPSVPSSTQKQSQALSRLRSLLSTSSTSTRSSTQIEREPGTNRMDSTHLPPSTIATASTKSTGPSILQPRQ